MLQRNQTGGLITLVLSIIALIFLITSAMRIMEERNVPEKADQAIEKAEQAQDAANKANNIINGLRGE